MKVKDLRPKGASWQVQPHEKGGKQHVMPCHHALAAVLLAYIEAAGIAVDCKGVLFRTTRGHAGVALSGHPPAVLGRRPRCALTAEQIPRLDLLRTIGQLAVDLCRCLAPQVQRGRAPHF